MSLQYVPVKWNANKRVYDFFIVAGITAYLTLFVVVGKLLWTGADAIDSVMLLMRGFGTCAFVLLHIVLSIGPLARLDRRFLPLLYNRRHLGVATFLMGLGHAVIAIGYYHAFGAINPFLSLLISNTNYDSIAAFPFEILGLLAFLILFLMAATSHDFWQKNLAPSVWKSLHMLVYPAYALLVMHVALGALQSNGNWLNAVLLGLGMMTVIGLHLYAGLRERRSERTGARPGKISLNVSWIEAGSVDDIAECRAKVVCIPGAERVAIFRHGNRISAVTNVCAHQRGPLGEGKVVDGCITCPWHGWNYRLEDGCSPPPFHERIATYRVRIEGRRLWLNPEPLAPGTPFEPAICEE
jgi:methionine sulfoxide reductase heme-binding subunit